MSVKQMMIQHIQIQKGTVVPLVQYILYHFGETWIVPQLYNIIHKIHIQVVSKIDTREHSDRPGVDDCADDFNEGSGDVGTLRQSHRNLSAIWRLDDSYVALGPDYFACEADRSPNIFCKASRIHARRDVFGHGWGRRRQRVEGKGNTRLTRVEKRIAYGHRFSTRDGSCFCHADRRSILTGLRLRQAFYSDCGVYAK